MSSQPKLFISFSSRDQVKIRRLFAALDIQGVEVWDYSDEGHELPVGSELRASLKVSIDSYEYFIAIISPNSIDQNLSHDPYFEVRYAIDSGKLKNKRLLPILLDNPEQWLKLYPELAPILRITLDHKSEERFESAIRRICDWLSTSYTPSSLKDPRTFFTQLFLEEIQGKELANADFIQLLRVMNSCSRKVLAEDWEGAKEKTSLFLGLTREIAPELAFHYPLVIKGVCELQLKEFEEAEKTFLQATANHDINSNPLLGLGYAGLGHTYAALQRFDESLAAFQKAVQQEGADEYLRFNHQVAILSAGGLTLNASVLEGFDLTKLSLDERRRLITLKGALHFRSGNFREAIRAFSVIDWNDLDEASAIYYSLALQENDEAEKAFQILSVVGTKTKSINVFHHLADAYLKADELFSASSVYKNHLCDLPAPSDYARQLLVEYAQIVRIIKGDDSAEIRRACERVVNFEVFPPPQSKADCFFTGFAYHFLGNEVLARHYYALSSGFCPQYYDECIRAFPGSKRY
jgi:tetratricopeptide (TPR) repeat protein